jgi:hypothetical protein
MTAPAQIDQDAKRERVVKAAVEWVYDQSCSSALMELEESVESLMGVDLATLENRSANDRKK